MVVGDVVKNLISLTSPASRNAEACSAKIFNRTVEIDLRQAGASRSKINAKRHTGIEVPVRGIEMISESRVPKSHFI